MEYDEIVEEVDSPYVYDESPTSSWREDTYTYITYSIETVQEFVAQNGWYLLFSGIALAYCMHWVKNKSNWFKGDPDAEYKKDPDKFLARMEAVQRARELQQRKLEEASRRALEQQRQREEQKRAEALERLQRYSAAAGQKLGTRDDDYLPLSAGASTSSYRPPKKSKCGGGGCGR